MSRSKASAFLLRSFEISKQDIVKRELHLLLQAGRSSLLTCRRLCRLDLSRCRYICRHVALHFCTAAVRSEIRYGNKGQAKALAKFHQFRCAGHGSVSAHDFAANADSVRPARRHRSVRRFRMARTAENATGLTAQRKDMPRAAEILRFGPAVAHIRMVWARSPAENPMWSCDMIDRNGKGRLVVIRNFFLP